MIESPDHSENEEHNSEIVQNIKKEAVDEIENMKNTSNTQNENLSTTSTSSVQATKIEDKTKPKIENITNNNEQ